MEGVTRRCIGQEQKFNHATDIAAITVTGMSMTRVLLLDPLNKSQPG